MEVSSNQLVPRMREEDGFCSRSRKEDDFYSRMPEYGLGCTP